MNVTDHVADIFCLPATPPSSPLKTTPPLDGESPPSAQQVSDHLEKSLAEETASDKRTKVKFPKRFSGAFPSVEELANIRQKKKVKFDVT